MRRRIIADRDEMGHGPRVREFARIERQTGLAAADPRAQTLARTREAPAHGMHEARRMGAMQSRPEA